MFINKTNKSNVAIFVLCFLKPTNGNYSVNIRQEMVYRNRYWVISSTQSSKPQVVFFSLPSQVVNYQILL